MQLVNLFSVKSMLKREQLIGELPVSSQVYRNFIKIAWPSALEALLVAMIGAVDTIMVGTLGKGAITAVGITNQPKFVLLAVIFSLNTGITAVTARRKGQGDQKGANRTVRTGIMICAVASILMAILGYLFAEPILIFTGAEPSYLKDAVTFFRVLMFSIPFQSLNLTINAGQRGCGKTQISMWTNIISNLINITFDYFLINGIGFFPRLEVKGAAIATTMGAIAAFLISLTTLLRSHGYLNFHYKAGWAIDRTVLDPIVKVSSSAFVEQVFLRIGFLAYAAIVARLGTTEYATHIICMNILTLSFCFGDGLSIAASALVGQNLGAKRPDLSIIYGKTGQRLAFMISCVVFLVFIFGRGFLVSLFNQEPVIIALGANIMILAAMGTHMQTSQVVLNGCLRGAGDTTYVAIVSLVSVALVRPLLTWVLCFPLGFGLYGAWVALLVDQCFRFIFSYTRFSSGKWTSIAL
ncbi:MAG TPA: MATE family efflux transporter [Mobilitalea sp.]|nr:MATE family efflux transporter [Mobilitalea sp.]